MRSSAEPVEEPVEEREGASTRRTFRPDIEGLRAVAVISVVLFHAEVPGVGGGFVGVDVFFVISGFLITGLLWREAAASGTVRLRRFYAARARRLLPASALVGIVTMAGALLLLPPLQVPMVAYDGIASALYVGNLWLILSGINYFADPTTPSPFQHYWSLGVEEQFYLVWPALILVTAWMMRKVRLRSRIEATSSRRPYLTILVVTAIVSFALSVVMTEWLPPVAYFSLPTRAWELALGGVVALTAAQWRRLRPAAAACAGWAGLALVVAGCLLLSSTTPYPGTAALLPTVGAVLIIGAGCTDERGGCGRLLGTPAMRAIGRISYSWYLWHWPVLVLAPAMVGHPLGLEGRVAAALFSAVLAVLTLRFVENPIRFGTGLRRSPGKSLGLGAVVTAMAVGAAAAVLPLVPKQIGPGPPAAPLTVSVPPVPAGSGAAAYTAAVRDAVAQVHSVVAESVRLRAVPENLAPPLSEIPHQQSQQSVGGCLRTPYETGQPECASGNTSSSTTVALFGDSHAAMWSPAFTAAATQRGWRTELLAKAACPPMVMRVDSAVRRMIERLQHCEEWRDLILDRLATERPSLIVVSMWRSYGAEENLSHFEPYSAQWLTGLTNLVRQLRATGAQVLVLGPVPAPRKVLPLCLSAHLDDPAACLSERSTAVNEAGMRAEATATEAGGGRYADVTDLFCTADRCPAIVGNAQVYVDVSHLTVEYSRLMGPVIAALAARSLAEG